MAPLCSLLCPHGVFSASVLPSHQAVIGFSSPAPAQCHLLVDSYSLLPVGHSHRYWGLGHISLGDTINHQRRLPCDQGHLLRPSGHAAWSAAGDRTVLNAAGGTGGQRPQEVSVMWVPVPLPLFREEEPWRCDATHSPTSFLLPLPTDWLPPTGGDPPCDADGLPHLVPARAGRCASALILPAQSHGVCNHDAVWICSRPPKVYFLSLVGVCGSDPAWFQWTNTSSNFVSSCQFALCCTIMFLRTLLFN